MSYGMDWAIEDGTGYSAGTWVVEECGARIICPTMEGARLVKAALDAHALGVNFYAIPGEEAGGNDACPACARLWPGGVNQKD